MRVNLPADLRAVLHTDLRWLGLAALVFLGACSSAPQASLSPLALQALEAETQGAQRYDQGQFDLAIRSFELAQQLHRRVDDPAGVARNLTQQARSQLSAGRPQAALDALATVPSPGADLLQLQATIALGDVAKVERLMPAVAQACPAACADHAALRVLQARWALSRAQPEQALAHAQAAVPLLQARQEHRELANAWRLSAQAHGQLGATALALQAANQALTLDRSLGLPERIAADWLLMGRLQHTSDPQQARAAYARAKDVALAAGLHGMVAQIDQIDQIAPRLKETAP